MKIIWLIWINLIFVLPVSAHNIIGGAYVEGMEIEGEIAFSNGEYAQAGVLVEVWDANGNKLGEVQTEDEGIFYFTATEAIQHTFKADLGSGHLANIVVEADEFALDTADGSTPQKPLLSKTPNTATTSSGVITVSTPELEKLIRKAVAQQVKPLQKELRAYKEKVMLRDIAGGIGFIFGLFGVAAWFSSRNIRQAQD